MTVTSAGVDGGSAPAAAVVSGAVPMGESVRVMPVHPPAGAVCEQRGFCFPTGERSSIYACNLVPRNLLGSSSSMTTESRSPGPGAVSGSGADGVDVGLRQSS